MFFTILEKWEMDLNNNIFGTSIRNGSKTSCSDKMSKFLDIVNSIKNQTRLLR